MRLYCIDPGSRSMAVLIDFTCDTPKSLMYDLKCKLGLKCGESIRKLADAPSFCHTASLQVGSGRGSKPS